MLITASASTLQDPISEPTFGYGKQNTVDTMNSAKVIQVTNPGKSQTCDEKEEGELSPENPKRVSESEAAIPKTGDVAAPLANITAGKGDESHENPSSDKLDLWTGLFKGNPTKLHKKGESYLLPLGESCVTIPNSVIEKNRRSWDSFIIGQFYSDPPSQGTIQMIVNGIWSKQFRTLQSLKWKGSLFSS